MSDTERPDPEQSFITAAGLRLLAVEADKCGAVRYAEAYRLVACRLDGTVTAKTL